MQEKNEADQTSQAKNYGSQVRKQHVDTSGWTTVVRMHAPKMFDMAGQTNKSSSVKHESKRNVLSRLMECLMAFKFYQTRPNTIKKQQTRWRGQTVKWLFTKQCLLLYSRIFPPTAGALIGYFEVTWPLTIKLFPAKSLWAGSIAKSMTSEGNSALLPANVDRWPPLLLPLHVFLFVLYNKSLNDWSLGEQFSLFPSNFDVFLGCASGKHWDKKKIEILGEQNELFP